MFMSVHNTMNVSKVIYKCREPILLLPVSNLSSILTLSLVEQELLTLPEHLSSPPVFIWVRVTRSLVSYVCFVDRCLSFCLFSFGHCVVCSLIYGFWLPLWYRQTLLSNCCLISSEQLFTISLRTIYFTLQTLLSLWHITFLNSYNITRGSHGCDHMVVGITTTVITPNFLNNHIFRL